MKEKSKRFGCGKIVLTVLLVLLAVVLAVLWFNRENIKALYKGLTTNTDSIGAMMDQNNNDTKEALLQSGMELSDDDLAKMNSGELSAEEIAALLYERMNGNSSEKDPYGENSEEKAENQTTPSEVGSLSQDATVDSDEDQPDKNPTTQTPSAVSPTPEANQKNDSTSSKPGKNDSTASNENAEDRSPQTSDNASTSPTTSNGITEEEYNRRVSELVAQIYVIKSNFTSELAAFETRIVTSYKALPAEQRTTATKARIVSENMGYVAGLEAQCDAQVNAVTSELSEFLTSCGKDTSLVDSIQTAYANEKALKKAYYVSLYK